MAALEQNEFIAHRYAPKLPTFLMPFDVNSSLLSGYNISKAHAGFDAMAKVICLIKTIICRFSLGAGIRKNCGLTEKADSIENYVTTFLHKYFYFQMLIKLLII